MITPHYQLVFSFTDRGFSVWDAGGFGFAFIGIGIALIVLDKFNIPFGSSFWKNNPTFSKLFNYVFLVMGILITSTSIHSSYQDYARLRDAVVNGTASVVEGSVEHFIPMPINGHALESFSVKGRHFEYSDFMETRAFNNTSSHGGPIKPGLLVRITYVGNSILRLEVAN